MMQFFLHGSRVAAIITLQKSQVDWEQGRVRFTAMKVSRQKDVELRPELRTLFCQYIHTPGPFMLPLLPKNYLSLDIPGRHRELTLARMSMRSALSRVGKKIGWAGSLHSHLARHSLALRAFQVSGGLELPKDMLGHSAISQTSTYIESISPERLDSGAASVYDSLL
jgi:integrase